MLQFLFGNNNEVCFYLLAITLGNSETKRSTEDTFQQNVSEICQNISLEVTANFFFLSSGQIFTKNEINEDTFQQHVPEKLLKCFAGNNREILLSTGQYFGNFTN